MGSEIERLNCGAKLVVADRTLKSAGWTIIFYGALVLIVSLSILRTFSGMAIALVGLALLTEGIFVRRIRNPIVMLIAGITLGVFCLAIVATAIYDLMRHDPSHVRGVVAAFFLGAGAWNLISSFRVYEHLLQNSDPGTNDRVRKLIEEMRTSPISALPDTIEWKKRSESKGVWRLRREGDLALLAHFADKVFGRGGGADQAEWLECKDVRFEVEGEKWLSKKLKAKLRIRDVVAAIDIDPEMLSRLEAMRLNAQPWLSSSSGR